MNKLALAEQGVNTAPLQAADFALIGLTVDAAALAQIGQLLQALPDSGSALNTFSQLRTLVLSVTGVPSWNVVAGDDVINLAERQAGVTLSGSAGEHDVLTLFYPDGTVMKSGITVTSAGNGRWSWSYTLTNADWARLNADNADGVEKVLQLQARNTMTNIDSIKVEHKVVIDTVAPPANLAIRLDQDTGSSATDGITSQGKVNVSNLAAGAQWEYQIDNGPFQTGSGNSFQVTQQGVHTLTVRQFDSAGNRSAGQTLGMTLDTLAPPAPVIALATVGGTVNELPVTNSDTIRLTGLEANATWQWRLNRNDFTDNPDWTNGVGSNFNPVGSGPNQNRNVYVEVRQVDQAGNASSVNRLSFTLDTTPPAAPRLILAGARGDAATGLFSNNRTIDIEGLEALGRWEYSLNGGTSFTAGTGTRLTLPAGDGQKSVIVRQYDLAGTATRNIVVEAVDQANNVGRGDVALSVDNTVPAQLNAILVPGVQKAFGLAKMADIFGNPNFPPTTPHNLNSGEGVALLPLPGAFANAPTFLAAIRGISAEWGGTAVGSDANRSNPNLKSYTLLNQILTPGQQVALMQQGAGSDVLGTWLNLTLARQTGKTSDDLFINHLGSFVLNRKDLYEATPAQDKSRTGIDLANIGLLYQIDTTAPNRTPTIQVGYDGSRAAVGDVVALFEGNTMLARKVLTSADVGPGNKTVNLTVAQSLAAGEHDIVTRYTDTAGNTVTGATQHVSVAAGSNPVTLTELSVRGITQAPAAAQALNASETGYAVVNDLDSTQASGHAASGPVISGKVGGGSASDRYVVTVEMGGKVLAFGEASAGDFSVTLPAGALAPRLYRDLTVTASRSDGAALGQSAVVQGLKLGWYWAAQSAGDILGGNGNDEIALGSTRFSTATIVQTGAGQDKIIVGAYGRTENLSATVSDFTIGVDKVGVFNQAITQANLSSFVRASAGANPNDTRLIIDLDGAGPGTLSYTLMLQNVVYNNLNTASIFGL